MQVHGLVTLSAGRRLNKSRATTFDLHAASGLLLDVFDVCATMADDLCPEVEAWDWLKVDGDLLVRPFSLKQKVLA